MPDIDPGYWVTPDDWLDRLNDHEDRIGDLEVLTAPLPGRITSLDHILGQLLANISPGKVISEVGGDARVHCTFVTPFADGVVPAVPQPSVGYTGPILNWQVIDASIDNTGFDIAVFYAHDAAHAEDEDPEYHAGDPASGQPVEVHWVAFNPNLIA